MARIYVGLAIGLWIMISPWLLGFSSITVMMWSNLLFGMALFLINLWAIFGKKEDAGGEGSSKKD